MTAMIDHPFATTLHEAALGSFPPPARRAVVAGPLPGPCDAVAFFAEHVVVAADVEEHWVREQLDQEVYRASDDPSTGLIGFLAALEDRLGNPPSYASAVTVAPHRTAYLRGKLQQEGEPEPSWAPYRRDVNSYRYRGGAVAGTINIGRGPGDRWDVFIRADETRQGGGAPSRELLHAALTLVPSGEQLYGSAPVHDPRALRTMIAGGFQPVCTEVLYLTRRGG